MEASRKLGVSEMDPILIVFGRGEILEALMRLERFKQNAIYRSPGVLEQG